MGADLFSLYLADPAKMMIVLSLCSVRILVAFAMVPLFSSATMPGTVRGGLALVVVFPVAMSLSGQEIPVDLTSWSLLAFFAKEAAVGLVIGLGFGAFFAGLQTVGEIIDHQTGLTFTQNIDAVHGNSVSLTARFLEQVLFTSLIAAGALLVIIDTVYVSYEVWPMGQWAPSFERATLMNMVAQASKLFALSLLLAGPVLLVLFIVDMGMGLLNRAAPQLSIFNITLSFKSLVGLGVLALALPMITDRLLLALRDVVVTLTLFLRTVS